MRDFFQIPVIADLLCDPEPYFSTSKRVPYIPICEVFCSETAEAVSLHTSHSIFIREGTKDLNLDVLYE